MICWRHCLSIVYLKHVSIYYKQTVVYRIFDFISFNIVRISCLKLLELSASSIEAIVYSSFLLQFLHKYSVSSYCIICCILFLDILLYQLFDFLKIDNFHFTLFLAFSKLAFLALIWGTNAAFFHIKAIYMHILLAFVAFNYLGFFACSFADVALIVLSSSCFGPFLDWLRLLRFYVCWFRRFFILILRAFLLYWAAG